MNRPSTLQDLLELLAPLRDITRPNGDNEGDAINSPNVYNRLLPDVQDHVDLTEKALRDYLIGPDGRVSSRAVNALTRRGYPTSLGPYEYEFTRTVGKTEAGPWTLALSDFE